MNQKQFLILAIIVVVLGLFGWRHWRNQAATYQSSGPTLGQKLLAEFPVNDVTAIHISHGDAKLTLAKRDELWRVTERENYPAAFSEISGLMLKLKDLKVLQSEPIGASQLARMELASAGTNHPTLISFHDAGGKQISQLTLGKKHLRKSSSGGMDGFDSGEIPDGRYVQVGAAKDRVLLISDPLAEVAPDAARWLDKTFFRIEKPKSISVTFAGVEAPNSWAIQRETESSDWQWALPHGADQLDPGKLGSVTSPFSFPSFNDISTGLSAEESGLDQPTVIKVSTFDGFDYTVNVGRKLDDQFLITMSVSANFPGERAAAADESEEAKKQADEAFAADQKRLAEKLKQESAFSKWTYQLSAWSVEQLLKPRSELVQAPVPDEETSETPESAE